MSETMVFDHSEGTPPSAIAGDFVPRPHDSLVVREVGDEIVLVDESSGLTHALDRIGSIVWSCFDGSADLGTIVDELAEAFGAPKKVVYDNVLELTKTLATIGLLANVILPNDGAQGVAPGAEVGQQVTPFQLPGLDGRVVDLTEFQGRPVLLVNWSPYCGYCLNIAQELGHLRSALEEQGTELLLMSSGEVSANRGVMEENGVDIRTALRASPGKDFVDPFPGMGTPVAYLLDEELRIAEPPAEGAAAVPALARKAAGIEEPAPEDGTKYLPAAAEGVCAPGAAKPKAPRAWRPTVAYTVGEYRVGIRTDSAEADEVIARLLAAHHVGVDPSAPAKYSVVIPGGNGSGAARDLNLLLFDNAMVLRTRSPRRLLLGLASYLSTHVGISDEVLRTSSLAAVSGGEAVLLPPAREAADLQRLQPQLARLGYQLVDAPYQAIDRERLELIVREPLVDLDLSVLAELEEPPPSRTELPSVEPGRYPVRAWFVWTLNDETVPSRAETLASAMVGVYTQEGKRSEAFDELVSLADRLPFFAIPSSRGDKLADEVQWHLAHSG